MLPFTLLLLPNHTYTFLVLSDPDCPGQILESHNNNIASEFIKLDDLPYPYKFIVPVSYVNHNLLSDFPVTVHR